MSIIRFSAAEVGGVPLPYPEIIYNAGALALLMTKARCGKIEYVPGPEIDITPPYWGDRGNFTYGLMVQTTTLARVHRRPRIPGLSGLILDEQGAHKATPETVLTVTPEESALPILSTVPGKMQLQVDELIVCTTP